MDEKTRFERGLSQRSKVLGKKWVERSMAARTPLNEEFLEFATRYAWGEIWTRPHFDERTRRILVIGTLMALARWEEFRLHVRAAITEGGFSETDLKEIIFQQSVYAGIPLGMSAMRQAAEVIAEIKRGAYG